MYLRYFLTEKKIIHSVSIYPNSAKLKSLVCTMGNTNVYHVLLKCKKKSPKEGRHRKWKAWKTTGIIQRAKRKSREISPVLTRNTVLMVKKTQSLPSLYAHFFMLWLACSSHQEWNLFSRTLNLDWPTNSLCHEYVKELPPCHFWACNFCPHSVVALRLPCKEAWASSHEDERRAELSANDKLPDRWVRLW